MFSPSSWGDDLHHPQRQQHHQQQRPHQPRAAMPSPLDFASQFSQAELDAAMHSLQSPPPQFDLFSNPNSNPFGTAGYRNNASVAGTLPGGPAPTAYSDLLYPSSSSPSSSSSPFTDPLTSLHSSSSSSSAPSSHPFDLIGSFSGYGSSSGNASPLTPGDHPLQARSHYAPLPSHPKPLDFASSPPFPDFALDSAAIARRASAPDAYHSYSMSDFPPPSFSPVSSSPASASPGAFDFQSPHHYAPQAAVPSQLHAKSSFEMLRAMKPEPGLYDDPRSHFSHPVSSIGDLRSLSVDDRLSSMNLHGRSGSDLHSFVRPYLEQYANTPNRIALGERTVIVMSSKVAQKSYGTEKRFLCPPPTAIMIGNSWWSDSVRNGEEPKLAPPRCVVSISGEPAPQEAAIEWTGASGKTFDVADPPTGTTYLGRCVGKQLFISDVDEKKKKVEALVKIMAPISDDEPERIIGTFPSRPIKVISKPSKKRQSAKNLELCINHGSTISLFHRLRSQTVSTKYLCVSGSGASFKGSDGQLLMGVDQRSRTATPSFIARTASWDPFIMYIVDVNKPSSGVDTPPPPPPQPDYPSPPPNAISFTNNGSQIPIYYNQTVVLQCLTSGVVSPVLIIRKVDRATVVVGGGLQEGAKGVPDHYCAPGEVCGDPVSQLHKIAFEVYDASKGMPPPGTPGITGAFLSCMGEKVNTYRPVEGRQWNSPQGSSRGSNSPSIPSSPMPSTPSSLGTPDYFAGSTASSVPDSPTSFDFPSSDGGRVKKSKQRPTTPSSSVAMNKVNAPPSAKGRRRHSSAGSVASSRNGSGAGDHPASSGALWQVDIGETSVWTIVGTDQVRYNFYVPPQLFNTPSTAHIPSVHSFPVPAKQVTPFPGVVKYLPPDRAAEAPKSSCAASRAVMSKPNPHANKMLTVYGENFSKTEPVTVFFGSHPSPFVEIRCTEVLGCSPPEEPLSKRVPIILVRGDGVIFPSSIMYP